MTRRESPIFLVITKVRITGKLRTMSDDFVYRVGKALILYETPPITVDRDTDKRRSKNIIEIKRQVFAPGEILIVDPVYGREYGWPGRKPSKWAVEFERFERVEDAVKRAKEIMDNE